jgi:phosphatidylglycerophosphate synthase
MSASYQVQLFGGLANQISLFRACLVVAIMLLSSSPTSTLLPIALLCIVFALDIADGIVARRFRLVSSLGGFVDIFSDRIVEMSLWLYFVMMVNLSEVVPLVLIGRIFAVDCLRLYAAVAGIEQTHGVRLSGWQKQLVASRASKGMYNILKMTIFIILLLHVDHNLHWLGTSWFNIVLSSLVCFSLVRAAPILVQYATLFSLPRLQYQRRPADRHTMLYVLQLIVDAVTLTVLLTWSFA